MQLSKKELSFIECFLSHRKSLTAKEVSKLMGISTKTVYRLAKKVNDLSTSGEIIETKKGVGLILNYDHYLQSLYDTSNDNMENSESRKNQVLLELLLKSPNPVSLDHLYQDRFVSNELIYKDLEKIKEMLEPHQIKLYRKDKFIWLIGDEKSIRQLIYDLISIRSFVTSEIYLINYESFNRFDADFVTAILEMMEKELGGTIFYPYNANIFSHLYILISRFRKGRINVDNEHILFQLDEDETEMTELYKEKYQLAKKVINRINIYLHTTLPEIETFYLFQYIQSSRINREEKGKEESEDKIIIDQIQTEMIKEMEARSCKSFAFLKQDEDFKKHLRLLIYRAKNEIRIKNEILRDIYIEYGSLYHDLQAVCTLLSETFQMTEISEDEIGFLVLYFAKSLEQSVTKKRVLIMCSSGVGTSELLKVKVQRAFPDLEIIDVVSLNQYKKKYEKNSRDHFDFILTTVNVENISSIPILLVNFMFTHQDQQNVMRLLEEL